MESKIRQLLTRITTFENDFRGALHQQESRMFYQLDGKRVKCDGAIRAAHRKVSHGIV